MTDAPERIWAVHDYVAGMTNILSGHIMLEPTEIAKTTEYVRADLVEAAEAKLAKAVEFIEDLTGCEWPYCEDAKRVLAELKGQDDDLQRT